MSNSNTTLVFPKFHQKFKGDAKELVESIVKKGLNREKNSPRRGHHEVLSPKQLTPTRKPTKRQGYLDQKSPDLGRWI